MSTVVGKVHWPDETYVDQLDAPPRAYFQIPLDQMMEEGGRVVLHIAIQNFRVLGPRQADVNLKVDLITAAVTEALHKLGGGIIWWRRRPDYGFDHGRKMFKASLRLGTSPSLPPFFWQHLDEKTGNEAETPLVRPVVV
jgi:hypothetical protein